MAKIRIKAWIAACGLLLLTGACQLPKGMMKNENRNVPEAYVNSGDTVNIATKSWKNYFSDPELIALIDTALRNNQELNIVLQEIAISRNEVRARKGEYLPFVGLMGGADVEKIGKYTWRGGVEDNLDIRNDPKVIESKTNYLLGAAASWEVDVWKKLRNAKKAAVERYLSSIDGKNYLTTNLIAEIADSFYELMALDNMLDMVTQNIEIQQSALQIVKAQKDAARVTLLAVNRFEAQLLKTQNLQFDIRQKIVETENRIHFLTGTFSGPLRRNSSSFYTLSMDGIQAGVPSHLLANRPDILQAEKELMASKLDINVARANFYPSFKITAQGGFQSYSPNFITNPEALVYNAAGELLAPLINRNAIKAFYYTASAKQIQAAYKYEQTILSAHLDVMNQLAKLENYTQSYSVKSKEVDIRNESVRIANSLFNSARAEYGEVLFSQSEVLDSKMELIEARLKQLNAKINVYRALGGGWR